MRSALSSMSVRPGIFLTAGFWGALLSGVMWRQERRTETARAPTKRSRSFFMEGPFYWSFHRHASDGAVNGAPELLAECISCGGLRSTVAFVDLHDGLARRTWPPPRRT